MKILLFLSLLLLLNSPDVSSQTIVVKETKEESKVCNLIARLPEVINADQYIKKVTNGKRHLLSYLGSKPTKVEPYYIVKVAEDNGSSYHTHFIFYVQPKTYQIFYMDTAAGRLSPEKQCRRKLISNYLIR